MAIDYASILADFDEFDDFEKVSDYTAKRNSISDFRLVDFFTL